MSGIPVNLSDEELYHLILEILSGHRYFTYFVNGDPEVFLFVQPTGIQRLEAKSFEVLALNRAFKEGLVSEKDLNTAELSAQLFTAKDEEDLSFVQSKVKAYEFLVKKRVKGSKQYELELQTLNEFKAQEQSLLDKKNALNTFTAEYKAREDKMFFLMSRCVLNIEGEPRWDSYEAMFEDPSFKLDDLFNILLAYLDFFGGKDVKVLRYIARSGFWRNLFVGSIRGAVSLFERTGKDLSTDQANLLSWSIYYQDIYDMSFKDRPPPEIIEHDEKLDEYLEKFTRKFLAEQRLAQNTQKSASDHDEVIVTAASDSYVSLAKQKAYSDTSVITSRVEGDAPAFSEAEEHRLKSLKRLKADR